MGEAVNTAQILEESIRAAFAAAVEPPVEPAQLGSAPPRLHGRLHDHWGRNPMDGVAAGLPAPARSPVVQPPGDTDLRPPDFLLVVVSLRCLCAVFSRGGPLRP